LLGEFTNVALSEISLFNIVDIFSRRCKKHNVPVEKIFNKTQRDKFRWAIEMADEDYEF
jgi:C-terminal topoisomerase domain